MVKGDERYPDFPQLECSACGERFDIPRRWQPTLFDGNQIVIDWVAGEQFMKAHHQEHNTDLISGLENLLREDAQRRGH